MQRDLTENDSLIEQQILDSANAIRLKICQIYYVVKSIIAVPALISSLSRIGEIGFLPVMGAHIGFCTCIWIITFFTVGHSTSIILSAFKIFNPDMTLIEILIPVTIIASAISNIFITKNLNKVDFFTLFISTFFGIIHGFGFANYFNQITFNDSFDYVGLIGFSIGVELAQLITVLIFLMLISFFNSFIKRNYRIYIALSSVIVCILTAILYI